MQNYNFAQLNTGQQQTFNIIFESIGLDTSTEHFFLNVFSETKMTFLYKTLCHYF